MTRRRTPQEKKTDQYTKDHVVLKGSVIRVSSAFRRTWPLKKAHVKRAYRRQVRQRLTGIPASEPDIFATSLDPGSFRRKLVRKWRHSVVSLGEIVEDRKERYVLRATKWFFWDAYDQVRDRDRFSRHLASQIGGRTKNSRLLAMYFSQMLDQSNEGRWADSEWLWEKGQNWLRAFFQDEPEWEGRLRTWIASFEQE